jgi:hypothetical protein
MAQGFLFFSSIGFLEGGPRKTNVPQRLKPHYKRGTCGTAEAVPLSKMDFSAAF